MALTGNNGRAPLQRPARRVERGKNGLKLKDVMYVNRSVSVLCILSKDISEAGPARARGAEEGDVAPTHFGQRPHQR